MRPMPERAGLRSLLRALGRRAPRVRGTLRVDGLDREVVVNRDRWGIPHVEAATDADAWFGLGFCHGQDRGFQLELLARAGRGTLAEILGATALSIDRLSRTLGFARVAAAQLRRLDSDVAATLEAYVAGINAASATSPRPHELVFLRTARRTQWRPEDVLAFLGLQSLSLAGNWDAELARLKIVSTDGAEALAAVDQEYAAWLPVTDPVGATAGPPLDRLAADIGALRDMLGGAGASNAWAVAGSRTASGAPILANDPHLAPSVPAPWYLAHLRTPDWEVAGASFVGGPAFPSGHTGHAAWGITAACTDSSDLACERIDLAAGTAQGPSGAEPIVRIREEIGVRGGPAVVEEVVVTRRGPVVTPVLDGVEMALSLRATWLEPVPARGLLDVVRACDFATFRESFRAWSGPALNVVYADADGHIGWQLIGTLPRRRAGNGMLPAPAWDPGWEDAHLPFDDLPWTLDPPEGFVASANNAPRSDAPGAPFLGVDWLDGYRAARLVECLAARGGWDVAASAKLQQDVASVPWREMRDLVLATPAEGGESRLALELLRDWDDEVSAGSAAASVFELLVAELASTIARESAPGSWRWAMGAGFGDAVGRTVFGARTVSRLVTDLMADPNREPQIASALRAAVTRLVATRGPAPANWAWGSLRPLRLRHPLGVSAPLDRMLNLGPVPLGGDTNTVAQAGVSPLAPTSNPAVIANHRMVVDLGIPDASRYVIAGGQSGNPLSPHYRDLFALWQRGEGVPIPWSPEAVAAATRDRLRLEPAPR
jgi:penicillin amidase